MKLFKVIPNPWPSELADGKHSWYLPGVRCAVCNKLMGMNVGYANLDIAGRLDPKPYELRHPVSWAEFEHLKEALEPFAEKEQRLSPSMGFGPFLGSVKHTEKRDFVWVWLHQLLPRENVHELLMQAGLRIDTGPAIMRDRKTREVRSDYRRIVELKVVSCLAAQTFESAGSTECAGCGKRLKKSPEQVFLEKRYIPENLPLFMPERLSWIIASAEFVEAVTRLKPKNIAFKPVEVV